MSIITKFNQFELLANLPINIIELLISGSEDIWKILKYPSANCLDMTDLSQSEKRQLIWNGENNHSENYRVFMDSMSMDDIFPENATILRIYPVFIKPENRTFSRIDVAFEVLCHTKISMLSNYQSRCLRMLQELFQVLNGSEVGSLGVLYFDTGTSKAQYNLYNGKSYKGYAMIMSTRAV